MKATEYVDMFRLWAGKYNTHAAVQELLRGLFEEMLKLADQRHCKHAGAWYALITEFGQKWVAICDKEPRLRKEAFMETLRDHPELGPWLKHCEAVVGVRHKSHR